MRARKLLALFLIAGGAVLLYEAGSSVFYLLVDKIEQPAVMETPAEPPPQPHTPPFRKTARETASGPIISKTPSVPEWPMRIVFPRMGVSLPVVDGTTKAALRRGPGHLEGTSLPGAPGNVVIAGHRDTHFRLLKDIRQGDRIVVERQGKKFSYRVTGTKIVTPKNITPVRPTKDNVLTLITCYPFYYVGPAPKRFIVRAKEIS